jgi:hypothetical protein
MNKCNLCNNLFLSKQALQKHLVKKNKCNIETDFQCKKCNKFFTQKKNLLHHTQNDLCKDHIIQPTIVLEPSNKISSKYDDIKNILNLSVPVKNKYELIKILNDELKLEKLVDILNYELPLETTISLILKSKKNFLEDSDEDIQDEEIFLDEKVNYIYLIQERENYEHNKNIFKFGKTSQKADTRIRRLQEYKKGSKVMMLIKCKQNLTETENKIREEFKKEFISHSDGHEHFEGNSDKMMNIIYSIVMKTKIE